MERKWRALGLVAVMGLGTFTASWAPVETLYAQALVPSGTGQAESQKQPQQQPQEPTQQQQDQAQQPQPSGPNPGVGETVLAPKKTEPAPPIEKKPERINPNEIVTLHATTNLVNVDVMVTDKDGNPIPSLGQKNFKVYDDGVPQAVTNFGTAQAPKTVAILLEFSNKYWGFLYLALEYAYQFVTFIQPSDWVGLVDFDMKPHILSDFTQDRSEIKAALDQERVPGFSETNLYDALAFVIDRMKDIQGRKAIVLVGTGIDTFSKLTYDQFLKIVKASDTVIYPISILEFMSVRYGENIETLQARNAMNTIAKYSGGQAYFPRFEGELPSDYQQIAGQLRLQYSLGFIPTNPAKDGRFHKLKVELVDDQGNQLRIMNQKGKDVKYRIVARDGYYAPKS